MKAIRISDKDGKIFSALNEVEKKGEMFVIYKNEKPVADLIPHKRKKSRITPHPMMSKIKIKYNPTEVLSRDEWPEEE